MGRSTQNLGQFRARQGSPQAAIQGRLTLNEEPRPSVANCPGRGVLSHGSSLGLLLEEKLDVISPLLFPSPVHALVRSCRGRSDPSLGRANVLSPLLSPQNTALDKEGQIFCSKHCQDSSRPGMELTSPVPPSASAEEPPVSAPAAAPAPPESPTPPGTPAASGCDRAGTWRRHRD